MVTSINEAERLLLRAASGEPIHNDASMCNEVLHRVASGECVRREGPRTKEAQGAFDRALEALRRVRATKAAPLPPR